jgi:dihydroxyacetone kinase
MNILALDDLPDPTFSDKIPQPGGLLRFLRRCVGLTQPEQALMVNDLGGTPISELYIVYGIAADLLAKKGIDVWRSYVGEYCTSLEMAGISITLCKVDDQLKKLFTAPAEIPIRVF